MILLTWIHTNFCMSWLITSKLFHPILMYLTFFSVVRVMETRQFEHKSNHLKIAVIARSKLAGHGALFLLQAIIDLELLDCFMDAYTRKRNKKYPLSKIADFMSQTVETYAHDHVMKHSFQNTLYGNDGEKIITRSIDEIDIWTLERLIHHAKENMDNDMENDVDVE